MRTRNLVLFVFYLQIVNSAVKNNEGGESNEDEINRKKILDQLTRTMTVLLDGYQLVTRQVATDVYMYRNYRSVSVLFFFVRRDVSDAHFTFQAEELHQNNIGSCEPQEVVVNLKYGSYPAVNPDGYHFPKDFIEPSSREPVHTIEFKSDGRNRSYSIENPKPGNWYAIAYLKWEDPKTQKVEQQGLVAVCQTILYTDLQVKIETDINLVDCYSDTITVDYNSLPETSKCMSLDSTDPVNIRINITNAPISGKKVAIKVQALSLPTNSRYLISCVLDSNSYDSEALSFHPNPSSWHYITLNILEDNYTNIADCELYYVRTDDASLNRSMNELMRDNKGRFFSFDYGLPTTDLQDASSLINLTSSEVTTTRFDVKQFLDIGGTLTLEAGLLMDMKYYMGYKRKASKDNLLAFTEDNQYFKVVICLDIGHTSVPLETGHCKYNDLVKPALFVLNSTDSDTIYDRAIIPYPESGQWYLSFKLFCDEVVCPCKTDANGTKYYVDMTKKIDVLVTNDTYREGNKDCNGTVVLSISSNSCMNGRCSNNGVCMLNTFGGLVMSFCSCSGGYGGWDCSDASRMDSKTDMLVTVLILTLSNILFFISVYIAIIRMYYPEAMMYFFTMIFSTFYHACDAPVQVAYCIARGSLLQFGDFYCGLMSFWVTLLAMSVVSNSFKSFLQLIGAIVIALLTTWNMHSFVAFLLPVAVGITVVLLSWYVSYRSELKMRYNRSYYTKHLPIGIVLVTLGLICYAFLQTEQNYKIVHSLWHMVVATSVVFLLPDVKRGTDINPFMPSPNYCRIPFSNIFCRSQTQTVSSSNNN